MTKKRFLTATAVSLVVLTASAHATTRYGWGTIVSVDFDGNPEGWGSAKAPHFRFLVECGNQISCGEWGSQLIPYTGRTRHGPIRIILDGKPATPKEALKAGRFVNAMGDRVMVISLNGQRSRSLGGEA